MSIAHILEMTTESKDRTYIIRKEGLPYSYLDRSINILKYRRDL